MDTVKVLVRTKSFWIFIVVALYVQNNRLVSASAQSVESWQFETVISNIEPVSISKLYDALHASFVLICHLSES